jgi:TM2 domain-containing membrane protein YozV
MAGPKKVKATPRRVVHKVPVRIAPKHPVVHAPVPEVVAARMMAEAPAAKTETVAASPAPEVVQVTAEAPQAPVVIPQVVAPAPPVAVSAPAPPTIQDMQLPPGAFEIVTRQINGKAVQMVRFRKAAAKKPASAGRKLLLAALPGFFGLMGLSQLYQGRRRTGLTFFISGAVLSFVSSWYILIGARVAALISHGSLLPAYAISLLSSTSMNASLASKLSMDLLGVVAILWGLQLFDAMGAFVSRQTIATLSSAAEKRAPLRVPALRRAITSAPKQPFQTAPENKRAS